MISLTKSPEWHARRAEGIGGSDANVIMGGDPERILQLWQEKTGQREPENLDDILPVQMGSWTEPLNRHWYTLTTGEPVTDENSDKQHPDHPWMRCEVDGFTRTDAGEIAIFDAKHVNAFSKPDEVAQRYMPQLHHNAACAGVGWAVLSVFIGTMKYEHFEVQIDPFYLAALIDRERQFWESVQSKTAPVELPAVAPPVQPSEWREVDMTGNNEWASSATDWLENKVAAGKFDKSAKALKALVKADVGKATGHGIEVKRAKNGSLRIKETK